MPAGSFAAALALLAVVQVVGGGRQLALRRAAEAPDSPPRADVHRHMAPTEPLGGAESSVGGSLVQTGSATQSGCSCLDAITRIARQLCKMNCRRRKEEAKEQQQQQQPDRYTAENSQQQQANDLENPQFAHFVVQQEQQDPSSHEEDLENSPGFRIWAEQMDQQDLLNTGFILQGTTSESQQTTDDGQGDDDSQVEDVLRPDDIELQNVGFRVGEEIPEIPPDLEMDQQQGQQEPQQGGGGR